MAENWIVIILTVKVLNC